MTTLELILLYEELVREYHMPFYKLNRMGKTFAKHKETFKKLKRILTNLDISPQEFMVAQFINKGNRPYPTQLTSKYALAIFRNYQDTNFAEALHKVQENYLKRLLSIGYTTQEALELDIFYYYFRCIKIKNSPVLWKSKASQEIKKIPGLKKYYVI